jgi:predicted small integral membrane protein
MEDVAFFSAQWWTEPLGTWMAWTRVTIAFFLFIAFAIACMGFWERAVPGGAPRYGVFRLDTTRGDRLFITLLGSAFIFIAWLFFFGAPLWWPLLIVAGWGVFVFRYV